MKQESMNIEAVKKLLRRTEAKAAELDRLNNTEPDYRREAETLKDRVLAAMGPEGLFMPASDCTNPELADALNNMHSLRTRLELLPIARANMLGELAGLKKELVRCTGGVRESLSLSAQLAVKDVKQAIYRVVRPLTAERPDRVEGWVSKFVELSAAGRWVKTFGPSNFSRDALLAARELIDRADRFATWRAAEAARAGDGA